MKSRWRSPATISLKARVTWPISSRERTGGDARDTLRERADRPGETTRGEQAEEQRREGARHGGLHDRDLELAEPIEIEVHRVVHAEHGDRPPSDVDDRRKRGDPRAARVPVDARVPERERHVDHRA